MGSLAFAGNREEREGGGDFLGGEEVLDERENVCIGIGIGIGGEGEGSQGREEEEEEKEEFGE